jgi:hypothetical protein
VTRRSAAFDGLPRRELLEALVRHHHHLQNEHQRVAPESSTRRKLGERLLDVQERFDRVLAEWVPEEDLALEWQQHLHFRAPEPAGPPPLQPLVFRGQSEVGSVAEIRVKQKGELGVVVDGSLVERLLVDDPQSVSSYRFDGTEFAETFTAPVVALQALADFVEQGGSPPWEHAESLLADGLVDIQFALTPRGRRALASLASG